MTICNMSIEAGARAGMIAPDETTFDYLKGRPHAPQGADWDAAVDALADAAHRRRRRLRPRGGHRRGQPDAVRHLGHQPGPGRCRCRRRCRTRRPSPTTRARAAAQRGAGVHGPHGRARRCATSPSTPSSSARAPTAGSRTCAPPPRCSRGRQVADGVRMLVVPGSVRVRLAGRGRGPGRGLHRRRRRVAARRLLDVPRHEPRPAGAGRAQRVDLQPQLRGPAGQGRPHPPGLAAGRRRDRRHRPPGRPPADLPDA